jgi:hypothetical protein
MPACKSRRVVGGSVRHAIGVPMIIRCIFVCAAVALVLGGCSPNIPRHYGRWLNDRARVPEVRLPDGNCLDMSALRPGWRIAATTSSTKAEFGRPGGQYVPLAPRFSTLVTVGDPVATIGGFRTYGHAWVGDNKPSDHDPSRDVPGFEGYPADDGETVYVSEGLGAFMECGVQYGCTVHDGLELRPVVSLDVKIPWSDRDSAKDRLELARKVIGELKVQCS